jgi:hypothetical protein
MIHITERCLNILDQEPGGPMCIQFHYRVLDNSQVELLRLKKGFAIIEFVSDHELKALQVSEFIGVEAESIVIDKEKQNPGASINNPVPG